MENTKSPPKGNCGICLNIISKDPLQFVVNLELSAKLTDMLNTGTSDRSVIAILPELHDKHLDPGNKASGKILTDISSGSLKIQKLSKNDFSERVEMALKLATTPHNYSINTGSY